MIQKTKRKKKSVFTVLIFILCGLLTIYTIASAYSVTVYIKSMIDSGSITLSDSILDIIIYYGSNCGVYVVYICLLLAIWWTKKSITTYLGATETDKIAIDDAIIDETAVDEVAVDETMVVSELNPDLGTELKESK